MDEIEYLEEYEDLILPTMSSHSGAAAKNRAHNSTFVSMGDDEDSSSIDQDIFESLFDDHSDDETVPQKKVSSKLNERNERLTLDSLDLLVKDLGEQLDPMQERGQLANKQLIKSTIIKSQQTGRSTQKVTTASTSTLSRERLIATTNSTNTQVQAGALSQAKVCYGSDAANERSAKQKSVATVRPTVQPNLAQEKHLISNAGVTSSNLTSIDCPNEGTQNVKAVIGTKSPTPIASSSRKLVTTSESASKSNTPAGIAKKIFETSQTTIIKPEKPQIKDPAEDPLSLENLEGDSDSDTDSFIFSDISADTFVSLSDIDEEERQIIELSNDSSYERINLDKIRGSTPSPTVSDDCKSYKQDSPRNLSSPSSSKCEGKNKESFTSARHTNAANKSMVRQYVDTQTVISRQKQKSYSSKLKAKSVAVEKDRNVNDMLLENIDAVLSDVVSADKLREDIVTEEIDNAEVPDDAKVEVTDNTEIAPDNVFECEKESESIKATAAPDASQEPSKMNLMKKQVEEELETKAEREVEAEVEVEVEEENETQTREKEGINNTSIATEAIESLVLETVANIDEIMDNVDKDENQSYAIKSDESVTPKIVVCANQQDQEMSENCENVKHVIKEKQKEPPEQEEINSGKENVSSMDINEGKPAQGTDKVKADEVVESSQLSDSQEKFTERANPETPQEKSKEVYSKIVQTSSKNGKSDEKSQSVQKSESNSSIEPQESNKEVKQIPSKDTKLDQTSKPVEKSECTISKNAHQHKKEENMEIKQMLSKDTKVDEKSKTLEKSENSFSKRTHERNKEKEVRRTPSKYRKLDEKIKTGEKPESNYSEKRQGDKEVDKEVKRSPNKDPKADEKGKIVEKSESNYSRKTHERNKEVDKEIKRTPSKYRKLDEKGKHVEGSGSNHSKKTQNRSKEIRDAKANEKGKTVERSETNYSKKTHERNKEDKRSSSKHTRFDEKSKSAEKSEGNSKKTHERDKEDKRSLSKDTKFDEKCKSAEKSASNLKKTHERNKEVDKDVRRTSSKDTKSDEKGKALGKPEKKEVTTGKTKPEMRKDKPEKAKEEITTETAKKGEEDEKTNYDKSVKEKEAENLRTEPSMGRKEVVKTKSESEKEMLKAEGEKVKPAEKVKTTESVKHQTQLNKVKDDVKNKNEQIAKVKAEAANADQRQRKVKTPVKGKVIEMDKQVETVEASQTHKQLENKSKSDAHKKSKETDNKLQKGQEKQSKQTEHKFKVDARKGKQEDKTKATVAERREVDTEKTGQQQQPDVPAEKVDKIQPMAEPSVSKASKSKSDDKIDKYTAKSTAVIEEKDKNSEKPEITSKIEEDRKETLEEAHNLDIIEVAGQGSEVEQLQPADMKDEENLVDTHPLEDPKATANTDIDLETIQPADTKNEEQSLGRVQHLEEPKSKASKGSEQDKSEPNDKEPKNEEQKLESKAQTVTETKLDERKSQIEVEKQIKESEQTKVGLIENADNKSKVAVVKEDKQLESEADANSADQKLETEAQTQSDENKLIANKTNVAKEKSENNKSKTEECDRSEGKSVKVSHKTLRDKRVRGVVVALRKTVAPADKSFQILDPVAKEEEAEEVVNEEEKAKQNVLDLFKNRNVDTPTSRTAQTEPLDTETVKPAAGKVIVDATSNKESISKGEADERNKSVELGAAQEVAHNKEKEIAGKNISEDGEERKDVEKSNDKDNLQTANIEEKEVAKDADNLNAKIEITQTTAASEQAEKTVNEIAIFQKVAQVSETENVLDSETSQCKKIDKHKETQSTNKSEYHTAGTTKKGEEEEAMQSSLVKGEESKQETEANGKVFTPIRTRHYLANLAAQEEHESAIRRSLRKRGADPSPINKNELIKKGFKGPNTPPPITIPQRLTKEQANSRGSPIIRKRAYPLPGNATPEICDTVRSPTSKRSKVEALRKSARLHHDDVDTSEGESDVSFLQRHSTLQPKKEKKSHKAITKETSCFDRKQTPPTKENASDPAKGGKKVTVINTEMSKTKDSPTIISRNTLHVVRVDERHRQEPASSEAIKKRIKPEIETEPPAKKVARSNIEIEVKVQQKELPVAYKAEAASISASTIHAAGSKSMSDGAKPLDSDYVETLQTPGKRLRRLQAIEGDSPVSVFENEKKVDELETKQITKRKYIRTKPVEGGAQKEATKGNEDHKKQAEQLLQRNLVKESGKAVETPHDNDSAVSPDKSSTNVSASPTKSPGSNVITFKEWLEQKKDDQKGSEEQWQREVNKNTANYEGTKTSTTSAPSPDHSITNTLCDNKSTKESKLSEMASSNETWLKQQPSVNMGELRDLNRRKKPATSTNNANKEKSSNQVPICELTKLSQSSSELSPSQVKTPGTAVEITSKQFKRPQVPQRSPRVIQLRAGGRTPTPAENIPSCFSAQTEAGNIGRTPHSEKQSSLHKLDNKSKLRQLRVRLNRSIVTTYFKQLNLNKTNQVKSVLSSLLQTSSKPTEARNRSKPTPTISQKRVVLKPAALTQLPTLTARPTIDVGAAANTRKSVRAPPSLTKVSGAKSLNESNACLTVTTGDQHASREELSLLTPMKSMAATSSTVTSSNQCSQQEKQTKTSSADTSSALRTPIIGVKAGTNNNSISSSTANINNDAQVPYASVVPKEEVVDEQQQQQKSQSESIVTTTASVDTSTTGSSLASRTLAIAAATNSALSQAPASDPSGYYGLTPTVLDSNGTRLYSFLHPAKYNRNHGCVLLDYCCPNLDGPMPAIDPTRIHAQVQAGIRELPAFIVMTTKLITRADLEANKNVIPASIRQKVEKITADANSAVNQTQSPAISSMANTSTSIASTMPLVPAPKPTLTPAISALQKHLPPNTIITPKMVPTTSATSTIQLPPLTPLSSFNNSQGGTSVTVTPQLSEYQRSVLRTSVRQFDARLKKYYYRVAMLSFSDRQNIIDNVVNSTSLTPKDVECAVRLLDEYATQISMIPLASAGNAQKQVTPAIQSASNTIVTPTTSTLVRTTAIQQHHQQQQQKQSQQQQQQQVVKGQVPVYDKDNSLLGYQLTATTITLSKSTMSTCSSIMSTTTTGGKNTSLPIITTSNSTLPIMKAAQDSPRIFYTKSPMQTSTPIAKVAGSSASTMSGGKTISLRSTPRLGRDMTIRQITQPPGSISTTMVTDTSPSARRLPALTRNLHLTPSTTASISAANTSHAPSTVTTRSAITLTNAPKRMTRAAAAAKVIVITQSGDGNNSPLDECILPDDNNAEIKREKVDEDFVGGN